MIPTFLAPSDRKYLKNKFIYSFIYSNLSGTETNHRSTRCNTTIDHVVMATKHPNQNAPVTAENGEI